jgi:SAM-dependent methyltransferase
MKTASNQSNESIMNDMLKYFNGGGGGIFGDHFSPEQIQEWYEQEAEAYAQMAGVHVTENTYNHYLNKLYGYKYLEHVETFDKALGFGSSWGYEFLPIIDKIKELYIIEPSLQTRSEQLGNITPIYYTPTPSGTIHCNDNTFDLITVIDAMHHVPNVTFVLNQLFRVLKPNGYLLLREPITSMGDWRVPRKGLTKNERGIPENVLDEIIKDNNIQVVQKHLYACMTPFFRRISHGNPFFNSEIYYNFDKYLSKLFAFNRYYHPTNKLKRIAPQCAFYVMKK